MTGNVVLEVGDWLLVEFRSFCLIDDPSAGTDQPEGAPVEDVEDYLPPPDPPEGHDLLTAAPGIVAITTGVFRGMVHVTFRVSDTSPATVDTEEWDTVEELGFRALSESTRIASGEFVPVVGARGAFTDTLTADGAGNYGVRAYERGRHLALGQSRSEDDDYTRERYLVEIWPTGERLLPRRRIKGQAPPLLG